MVINQKVIKNDKIAIYRFTVGYAIKESDLQQLM